MNWRTNTLSVKASLNVVCVQCISGQRSHPGRPAPDLGSKEESHRPATGQKFIQGGGQVCFPQVLVNHINAKNEEVKHRGGQRLGGVAD